MGARATAWLVFLWLGAAFAESEAQCIKGCQQDTPLCVKVCKEYAKKAGARCSTGCAQVEKQCIDDCQKRRKNE
ncbi:MAG: hypothetical protein ACOZIN_20000 [Myxococcota bacterium]